MTTPQGIAAALRAIAEPPNPTPDLISAVDAAKAALDNLWTDVADVLVAIDRAADNVGAV